MASGREHRTRALLFTVFLVGLIGVAVAPNLLFLPLQIGVIVLAFGIILWIFPGSTFFAIALANFMAIYTCFFILFWESNFRLVDPWAAFAGYGLPIAGFLAGSWWRRARIGAIVGSLKLRDEGRIGRVFLWFLPIVIIGGATFLVPGLAMSPRALDIVFLAAMLLIGLIVLRASENVATFLLDAGILFEEFFAMAARLAVPAFAFLTFYSLIVVVFAAIYRIIDRYTAVPQFLVLGERRELSFADALYFSIVTLSTVGYGDITPATNVIRVLTALELICGIVLLLFGFNEIIAHARRRDRS